MTTKTDRDRLRKVVSLFKNDLYYRVWLGDVPLMTGGLIRGDIWKRLFKIRTNPK